MPSENTQSTPHECFQKVYLLGFSGGVDSVALFFLLLEAQVPFDIAIIHYHTRKQADEEVAYAQSLAKAYNKLCHIAHAPHFEGNFESQARVFRFEVFDRLIDSENYVGLILAHQLNDHLEWLFMQLSRGAGLDNLLGFENIRASKNRTYPILRPLQSVPKDELYDFCHTRGLRYFEDSSNEDLSFSRNAFRHRFCNDFVREFGSGVEKSLRLLREDRAALRAFVGLGAFAEYGAIRGGKSPHKAEMSEGIRRVELGAICRYIKETQAFIYAAPFYTPPAASPFSSSFAPCELDSEISESSFSESSLRLTHYAALQACDTFAKRCGYVLSSAQREEILKSDFNVKIHHLIVARNKMAVYVALDLPSMYQIVTTKPMDKNFKQLCAKKQVPPKLRKMLWAELCLSFAERGVPQESSESSQNTAQILKFYDEFWQKMGVIFDL